MKRILGQVPNRPKGTFAFRQGAYRNVDTVQLLFAKIRCRTSGRVDQSRVGESCKDNQDQRLGTRGISLWYLTSGEIYDVSLLKPE